MQNAFICIIIHVQTSIHSLFIRWYMQYISTVFWFDAFKNHAMKRIESNICRICLHSNFVPGTVQELSNHSIHSPKNEHKVWWERSTKTHSNCLIKILSIENTPFQFWCVLCVSFHFYLYRKIFSKEKRNSISLRSIFTLIFYCK